jgi:hypothetical protein
VYSALMEQSYVEEAAVVVAFAVQPGWWADRYQANVAALVERGLLDPARHAGLLSVVGAGPSGLPLSDQAPSDQAPADLATGLIGEAMMGVAAAMLTAIDAGLGATVTACRPGPLAQALGLPSGAVLCPWGVLTLGWPVGSGDQPAAGAPKPAVGEMYFGGSWDRPLTTPVG